MASFLVDTPLQSTYPFAFVMCKHVFCMQVCFCRWALIFAIVHCSKGFTGSLYLQDLHARIKIAFLEQSHIAPTTHCTSSEQLWQYYIQILSKQKANSPSSPCSCPFQEVKSKSQTFTSAQATDFLRLLVSSVASCTRAFPEQSHSCSSTQMIYIQTAY